MSGLNLIQDLTCLDGFKSKVLSSGWIQIKSPITVLTQMCYVLKVLSRSWSTRQFKVLGKRWTQSLTQGGCEAGIHHSQVEWVTENSIIQYSSVFFSIDYHFSVSHYNWGSCVLDQWLQPDIPRKLVSTDRQAASSEKFWTRILNLEKQLNNW